MCNRMSSSCSMTSDQTYYAPCMVPFVSSVTSACYFPTRYLLGSFIIREEILIKIMFSFNNANNAIPLRFYSFQLEKHTKLLTRRKSLAIELGGGGGGGGGGGARNTPSLNRISHPLATTNLTRHQILRLIKCLPEAVEPCRKHDCNAKREGSMAWVN
jgi:hypothetical protein